MQALETFTTSRVTRVAVALALLLVAGAALAHPGHQGTSHSGFASGFAHPLLGLDHLLAMAAIGLWSLRQSNPMRRGTPWLAAAGMLFGAGLAWGGLVVPSVETGIALSVLLAGVLIAAVVKLPTLPGGLLVVVFMLFHGHAHASEIPYGASMMAYLAGFLSATLVITYASRVLGGYLMARENRIVRALGVAIALVGGFFTLA
ncbi:HupE/UreJ family protein [Litchfieldella rifensis]|uniref:HupE/UreJ family protein n=1 Tax=Litchfieldella rifensis TaxID=762643 RepID=A0ABV7LWT0_9GAMM